MSELANAPEPSVSTSRPHAGHRHMRHAATKGVFWTVVGTWGGQGTNLLVFAILARFLSPRAFGLVALATIYLALMDNIVDQGFASALIQRKDIEPEHVESAFWVNIGTSLLLVASTVIAAPWIAHLFRQPELDRVVAALSVTFFLGGLIGVQEAQLRRHLQFRSLTVRTLAANIIGGVIGVWLAIRGAGVWALVAMQIAKETAAVFILWRATGWRPRLRFSGPHLKSLMGYSLNFTGARMLGLANGRAPDLLIGYFLGAIPLGVFSVAKRVVTVMLRLVSGVTMDVALPAFARVQHDPTRVRRGFYAATEFTSLIALPIFAGIAVLAPDLMPLLFGPKWNAGIPLLALLSVLGMLESVSAFNGAVIMALGRSDWQFGIQLLLLVTTVIAFFIALPYGLIVIVAAILLRSVLLAPVPLEVVRRLTGMRYRHLLAGYLPPIAATLGMVAAVYFTRLVLRTHVPLVIALPGEVLFGAAVYVGLIRLLAPTLFRQAVELAKQVASRARVPTTGEAATAASSLSG